MKVLDVVAALFLIIGGLNWGLVGTFDFNLIDKLFGAGSIISRVVYILAGLSAIYQIVQWPCMQERWSCKK